MSLGVCEGEERLRGVPAEDSSFESGNGASGSTEITKYVAPPPAMLCSGRFLLGRW